MKNTSTFTANVVLAGLLFSAAGSALAMDSELAVSDLTNISRKTALPKGKTPTTDSQDVSSADQEAVSATDSPVVSSADQEAVSATDGWVKELANKVLTPCGDFLAPSIDGVKSIVKNGSEIVINLASDHPYYTAGVAAIILVPTVTLGVYDWFKRDAKGIKSFGGKIKVAAKAVANNKLATLTALSLIASGRYGYKTGDWKTSAYVFGVPAGLLALKMVLNHFGWFKSSEGEKNSKEKVNDLVQNILDNLGKTNRKQRFYQKTKNLNSWNKRLNAWIDSNFESEEEKQAMKTQVSEFLASNNDAERKTRGEALLGIINKEQKPGIFTRLITNPTKSLVRKLWSSEESKEEGK